MWDSLWTAFALVLIIEGFLPFLSPQIWKRTVAQIAQLQDGQIRFFALLALGAGVLMLCFYRLSHCAGGRFFGESRRVPVESRF